MVGVDSMAERKVVALVGEGSTPSPHPRNCILCGEPITACMGFVLCRDFIKGGPCREVCAKCGVRALDNLEEVLEDVGRKDIK